MHKPKYFQLNETQQILDIIKNNSLATIVSVSSTGLVGNHIPMIVVQRNDQYFLQGHVARPNSIWKDYDNTVDVLAIFNGPDTYISPNWYPSKQVDHKEVPTWNYVTVHVSGSMQFYHDKDWLKGHLNKLVDINEKPQSVPWKVSDAPDDFIDKMLNAIVGIEIEIKTLTGQSKMSQNHPDANRQGVIKGLQAQDKSNIAKWIEKPNGQ